MQHGLIGYKQKKEHINKRSKKVKRINVSNNEIKIFNSMSEAARSVKGSVSAISEVCKGNRITHKGFMWSYVLEDV